MSIKRKLRLILALTCTAPLLVICAVVISHDLARERVAMTNEVATLAEIAAWNSRGSLTFDDKATAERTLAGLRANANIIVACIYDREGMLFASYQAPGRNKNCPERAQADGAIFDANSLALTEPISLDGSRIGTVSIQSNLNRLRSRTVEYLRFMPALFLGAIILTLMLSSRLQRSVSDPILSLVEVARIVTERKDYSVRAPRGGPDEIGSLTEAFNDMLAQIGRHAGELTRMNYELAASKIAAEKEATARIETEKRFHTTFEEGPIGMMLLSADGAVLESNRSIGMMLGYTREELNSMRLADFTHAEDVAADMAGFRGVIQGQQPRYQIEKRYVKRSGQTVWGRVTVSRCETKRGELLAIAMTEDLSERKQLEEQFRQAQKMEAIGRLAGGVAHDFNNLLTVIKGNTELLIRRVGEESPMQRNLGQVRKAADRAASLVDQLLAFSRKQFIAPKVQDVSPVIREMEAMLRPLIGEDIELVVDVCPKAAYVNSDPVQLQQIVLNLAINARDAMPGGGRLVIRTSIAPQSPAVPDWSGESRGFLLLTVEDTGTGMSEEVRAHIFEPFFTTKDVGKGTGLGLSTVYGLVQQIGGTIEVQTALGRGSTFLIRLPLADPALLVGVPEAEAYVPDAPAQKTILVVEDEELVRTIICETLSEHGYRVLEAESPAHALSVIQSNNVPIHLLLTDVVMPGMNGKDLADKIRAIDPAITVLYISGYTELDLVAGSDFLKKPFTPDELLRKLHSVFETVAV